MRVAVSSKRKGWHILAALLAVALLAAACSSSSGSGSDSQAPSGSDQSQQPSGEAPAAGPKVTLAIEHFSVIEGTTWSGAHHRAAQRLVEKYPNTVGYIYREEVGPDSTNPFAEDMIASEGADIIIGNAEFMGLPLIELADRYPDLYFGTVIDSDLSSRANFIRFYPKQYQALYLEGLVAGALTQTGNVGIVSAFPAVQVLHRQAGFVLGVFEAARVLNKDVNVYIKYVGDWYLPSEERDVARTLIDQYGVDVITQQTDSVAPLDAATEAGIWFVGKDMDVVGEYGWATTDTVAISFDTRWEVIYDRMIKDWLAGDRSPINPLFMGMADHMVLADGTLVPTVDIMNDGKVGIDAISPRARAQIPQEILDLVEARRDQMIKGVWDPFFHHELVSNGTGLDLENLPVPPAGTVVKPAGQMPTTEWILGQLNFDLHGVTILE